MPLVFVGTYTHGESRGIYTFRFDPVTGALHATGQVAEVEHPSYLAIHPGGRLLYAVNETGQFAGNPGGGVSAFAIDAATGALSLLNQERSHGAAPCYVCVDPTGRCVLVANYSSGNVAVLPVEEDGRLAPASQVLQHAGQGPNPARQEGPHAHCITFDRAGRFVFAVDLGVDRVFVYQLDAVRGELRAASHPFAETHPGAGPRHIAFHPDGRFAYVINELDSTLTPFIYHGATGALTPESAVPTLPAGFTGTNHPADVHVHPSGRFLYGSNRGHDSIAIYSIDDATGQPTPLGHQSTQGRNPRGFALDPTGRFLLVANQDTGNIVTFRIDPCTGMLEPTGRETHVPTPVCLKFLPV